MTENTGWGLIPPYIMASKDLSANEKLVYGRILGLTNKHGYCWASNRWLGLQIGLEEKTIANIIWNFKKMNLIETKVLRDDKKQIVKRHIFVRNFPIQGTPIPAIGNTYSLDKESNRVESRVERVVDSTHSDIDFSSLESKFSLQRKKYANKNKKPWEKERVSSSARTVKNPNPLSQQEIYTIAHELSIPTYEVKDIQKQVLIKIRAGEAEKYNITSLYNTVQRWCMNAISNGKVQVLTNEWDKDNLIEDWSPEAIEQRLVKAEKCLVSGFWTQEEYDREIKGIKDLV